MHRVCAGLRESEKLVAIRPKIAYKKRVTRVLPRATPNPIKERAAPGDAGTAPLRRT